MSLQITRYIDHTVLKETTTLSEVEQVCREAAAEHFAAVCIPPQFVPAARALLVGVGVKVATVIAFPSGILPWEEKVSEIEAAIEKGADELDMVIHINALKNGDFGYLEEEITACLEPIKKNGKILKIIVESGILTTGELLDCCRLYRNFDIDFMKTSTGFASTGATVEAVKLMRANLPATTGIKAAGGIRTFAFARDLILAGATRLGCSASMQILKESRTDINHEKI